MTREKQEIGTTSGEGFPLSHNSLDRPRSAVAGSGEPVLDQAQMFTKHS